MKKKLIAITLALVIIMSIFGVTALAADANPTASTVSVNGKIISFEAYNIGGNNFFKLRDLAYVLNGTEKQFEVGYDNDTRAITLTSGKAYTPTGNQEMIPGDGKAKAATPTPSRIYLDGKELNFTVYNIGGNNFFKLRDLMEALDVFVGYDNDTKAITLDTSKGYIPEGTTSPTPEPEPTPTQPSGGNSSIVGMWRSDSVNKCVNFFYENGTFSHVRWSTDTVNHSSQLMCYKGTYTYNTNDEQITVTELSRLYVTPTYNEFGELIDDVISTMINGSKEEVLALLDLNHPIYSGKQVSGKSWTTLSPSELPYQDLFEPAAVEFRDDNHIHLSKFLRDTADYERVN